jgi:hypothetical protein
VAADANEFSGLCPAPESGRSGRFWQPHEAGNRQTGPPVSPVGTHFVAMDVAPPGQGGPGRDFEIDEADWDTFRILSSGVGLSDGSRRHQALGDETSASRFDADVDGKPPSSRRPVQCQPDERTGEQWVARKVATNGVVCVGCRRPRPGSVRRLSSGACAWNSPRVGRRAGCSGAGAGGRVGGDFGLENLS